MRLSIIIVVMVLLIATAQAYLDVSVYPLNQRIRIGESATYTISVDVGGDAVGDHVLGILFLDEHDHPTDKITGEVSSPDVALTQKTCCLTPNCLKYEWKAGHAGTYDFNLEVWFQGDVKQGDKFKIVILDNKKKVCVFASAVAGATAIPEFTTIAFPALAVVGLIYLFQRRKT